MPNALDCDWLVPDWPAPVGVRAVFTTRSGGVSNVPFNSMNLGDHVGDLPTAVAANRVVLQRSTGVHSVFMNQVHGAVTLQLEAASPDAQMADACVTRQSGLACTVMVADCLPVLLATQDGTVVAAAHAGWRGLVGAGNSSRSGVLESVYASFRAISQAQRAQAAIKTIAWLGPCIGPSAFEVGEEVRTAFIASQRDAARFFVPAGPGKYLANLPALARLRLKALGVADVYGNDGSAAWCTVGNPSRFFSHRRDAGIHGNGFGTTGRMAACIWRD